MQKKTIEQVLSEHSDSLLAIPGVVGVGIGGADGKLCIKVMVDRKTKDIEKKIPKAIDGYSVVIEETGEIRAR